MTRLLTRESSHHDAAILKDLESFKRAKRLYDSIDLAAETDSAVRHIASMNKLVFKIQLDETLMWERKSYKNSLNKFFGT